jgi:hypothetical protein
MNRKEIYLSLLLKDASVCVSDPNHNLDPHMMFALGLSTEAYAACRNDCIVTSACDGHHNPGRFIYWGALDLRTLFLTEPERIQVFDQLKSSLAPLGFDVVLEAGVGATPATTAAHIHIEYDPRAAVSGKSPSCGDQSPLTTNYATVRRCISTTRPGGTGRLRARIGRISANSTTTFKMCTAGAYSPVDWRTRAISIGEGIAPAPHASRIHP